MITHSLQTIVPNRMRRWLGLSLSLLMLSWGATRGAATSSQPPDQEVGCEVLVIGGGLAGTGAAYEALLAGRTVCLTEITDWVGGQISSQGTSALDERTTQRSLLFYPRGYLELRQRIQEHYGQLNPGDCWVSYSCFLPQDGHELLLGMLQAAAKRGKGTLHWFPSTVIKDLEYNPTRTQITGAIAIQHQPARGTPPLNTDPLSRTLADAYAYGDSDRFVKTILRFHPLQINRIATPDWYVVEATETGEILALTDVPYRLGIDPRSHLEPSSSSETGDPYCTQGFTYTFAMEALATPQSQPEPPFYEQYAPYYSYELERLASFPLVFTYRRIYTPNPSSQHGSRNPRDYTIAPGDISMQNWTWGNDYRPGTAQDNLVYTREQLHQGGQLAPGGWQGGLRLESLQQAEALAQGYYYWLVAGTTDSQLGLGVKKPHPNHRYLAGFDTPMGTAHGLSKYPYMREGRRLIGRPSWGRPTGFTISELDISRRDYQADAYYRETLPQPMYKRLLTALAGLEIAAVIQGDRPPARRARSTIYPDSVGIGHYAIDFHPCMTLSPPERSGNTERAGERRGAGQAYPFQIPLRALIPQRLDNLLVAGKSIATSHIAAAAYRVHAFEWSVGAAVGTTAAFALEQGIFPYELVDDLPRSEPELETLQRRLVANNNPIAFPNTSIFNQDWQDWR